MTGFIDIQVNGYGGVNYHDDYVTAETLRASCEKLQSDGVEGILATITSAPFDRILHRLKNTVTLRAKDPLAQKLIRGLHIEGPFMSAVDGYRGAHPIKCMVPVNLDVIKQFYDACDGLLRILTLAPEQGRSRQQGHRLAGPKRASPSPAATPTPPSINLNPPLTPASPCGPTWATAAPPKCIATTTSSSASFPCPKNSGAASSATACTSPSSPSKIISPSRASTASSSPPTATAYLRRHGPRQI